MERIPVDWLMEIPPVTRTYLVGVVGVSLLEYAGVLSKSDFFYSPDAVFQQGEYYRLLTSFFYFGTFSFDLLFTLYVITRYSKALEQSYSKTKDYMWCLFVLSSLLLIYSALFGNLYFLGSFLNDTLLYIWSRRNPEVEMTILGLVNFQAVYLPIVSVVLSRLASAKFEINWRTEFAGVIIGQFFLFFNDMYPKLHDCDSPLRPIWYWGAPEHGDDEQVDQPVDLPAEPAQIAADEHIPVDIPQHIEAVPDAWGAEPLPADGIHQRQAF